MFRRHVTCIQVTGCVYVCVWGGRSVFWRGTFVVQSKIERKGRERKKKDKKVVCTFHTWRTVRAAAMRFSSASSATASSASLVTCSRKEFCNASQSATISREIKNWQLERSVLPWTSDLVDKSQHFDLCLAWLWTRSQAGGPRQAFYSTLVTVV